MVTLTGMSNQNQRKSSGEPAYISSTQKSLWNTKTPGLLKKMLKGDTEQGRQDHYTNLTQDVKRLSNRTSVETSASTWVYKEFNFRVRFTLEGVRISQLDDIINCSGSEGSLNYRDGS